MADADAAFVGSIPSIYDRCLGPLLFEPYAADIARRLAALRPGRVLETAAGTGIVTETIARALPDAEIVATDLNKAMLDVAAAKVGSARASFQAADAQSLPFEDGSFDAVVCQFGIMFFSDRGAAYREAWRVLQPGGRFHFNSWDTLDRNPVAAIVSSAIAELFPDDPPSFLSRVPFGHHDKGSIEADLRAAGFIEIVSATVRAESRITEPRDAAVGLCQGSPLRTEIEERDPSRLEEATDAATTRLEHRGFGRGSASPLSAHVFTATKEK